MTKWLAILGGGGAAAAAVGTGLYFSGVLDTVAPKPGEVAVVTTPEPSPDIPASEAPAPEAPVQSPETDTPEPETTERAVGSDQGSDAADTPMPVPPSFDVVRIDPDGAALVAGRAVAGVDIRVLLDADEISRVTSGRDGKFVSLFDIAPSDQPRLLALAMQIDGQDILSETEVIVAPFGAEEKLAEAGAERSEPEREEPEAVDNTDAPDQTETAEAPAEAAKPEEPTQAPEPEIVAEAGEENVSPDADADRVVQSDTEEPAPVAQEGPDADVIAAEEVADLPETVDPDRTVSDGAGGDAPANEVTEAPTESDPALATAEVTPEADTPDVENAPKTSDTPDQTVEEIKEDTPDTAPEPEAPPKLLASDEDGVRVLAGPEVLDAVAIDTISYDDEGDVALAGRGAGTTEGGFVRVYLDNTPITTSRIREDGSWQVDLPEVDKGVYTLRVDEVDEDGDVKSRAETPFQREDRETLERVAEAEDTGGPVRIVTVQPGNTLWQIARDRYGEGLLYVRVFDANKADIRNPDLIYPGQVFDLPDDETAVQE